MITERKERILLFNQPIQWKGSRIPSPYLLSQVEIPEYSYEKAIQTVQGYFPSKEEIWAKTKKRRKVSDEQPKQRTWESWEEADNIIYSISTKGEEALEFFYLMSMR